MRKTTLVILTIVSMAVLAGCGGGSGGDSLSAERGVTDSNPLVGTWQISSNLTPVMNDIVFKVESTDSLSLSFNPGGTLEATEYLRGGIVAISQGTWSASGTHVRAGWTACDATLTGELFGDTLVLSANDGTPERIEMHFSRVR